MLVKEAMKAFFETGMERMIMIISTIIIIIIIRHTSAGDETGVALADALKVNATLQPSSPSGGETGLALAEALKRCYSPDGMESARFVRLDQGPHRIGKNNKTPPRVDAAGSVLLQLAWPAVALALRCLWYQRLAAGSWTELCDSSARPLAGAADPRPL